MRAQGLETLFPKYLTPHTAYDTNKVNICVDFFLFSKENPEIQRFVEKSPIFLKIYCNSKQVKQKRYHVNNYLPVLSLFVKV